MDRMPIEADGIRPDVGVKPRADGFMLRKQLRHLLAPGFALSTPGLPIDEQAKGVLEYLYDNELSDPRQQYNREPSAEIIRELVERFSLPLQIARQVEKWHRNCPEYMVTIAIMAMAGDSIEAAYLAIQDD